MTRPIVMITLISLSIFYALVTVPSMAQERDGNLQIIEDCIEQANTLINGWEKQKIMAMALTILVGTLGVLTGILQKYDQQWSKLVILFAGATISLITIVNNTIIQLDYRTFRSLISDASDLRDDMIMNRANYKTVPDLKKRYEDKIKTLK